MVGSYRSGITLVWPQDVSISTRLFFENIIIIIFRKLACWAMFEGKMKRK